MKCLQCQEEEKVKIGYKDTNAKNIDVTIKKAGNMAIR